MRSFISYCVSCGALCWVLRIERTAVQLADCTFFIPVMYSGRSVASQSKRDCASDIYGPSQEQCYQTDLYGSHSQACTCRTAYHTFWFLFHISPSSLYGYVSKGFAEILTSTISYCLLFSACTTPTISQIRSL